MIYHDKCNSPVLLDVSGLYSLIGPCQITDSGIVVSTADVVRKNNSEVKFFCSSCKNTVEIEDLYILCSDCGVILKVSEAFKVKSMGGLYCLEHAKQYAQSPSDIINVLSVISKVR